MICCRHNEERRKTMTMRKLTMFALLVTLLGTAFGHPMPVYAKEARAAVVAPVAKVNLNQAGLDELESIKGIGPALAERIMAHRKENGNFKTVEDLMKVKGIGQSKFDRIKDQLAV